MKKVSLIFALIVGQASYGQSYLRDGRSGSGYFNMTVGSYAVSPNMGSSSVLGFGTQFFSWKDFGFGVDVLVGNFKPSPTIDGNSRILTSYVKYYALENFNIAGHFGIASQNFYSTSSGQPVSAYGTYGISLGYDLRPQKLNLIGYSIDVQSLSIANNPAQAWLGGKFSIKFWFD